MTARLTEFREHYGDEAATALEQAERQTLQLQQAAIDRDWHAEFDRAKTAHEQTVSGNLETMTSIRQVPQLHRWLEESNRHAAGDATASPHAFRMAQTLDDLLRSRPEWQGRPVPERFAAVAQQVQTLLDGPATPAATGEQLLRSVTLDAHRGPATPPGPGTLSDLAGGNPAGTGHHNGEPSFEEMVAMSHEDLMNLH